VEFQKANNGATMRQGLLLAAKGYAFAALLIVATSLTSGVVLTHNRLVSVIREAFATHSIANDGVYQDWINCTWLSLEYTRTPDPLRNTIETDWSRPVRQPCDDLRVLVAGPPYPYPLNPTAPYENYAFGARHLQAIVLSVLSVGHAQAMYGFLSYASIGVLFLGGWLNSRRLAITVLLPITVCLTVVFEQQLWARSIAWAPAFFVGFIGLGIFLARRATFVSRAQRLGFFCFLGVIIAYLDLFQGSIPVVLSLAIVLNHFFYVSQRSYTSSKEYVTTAVLEALSILGCFLLGFVVLTGVRMLIVLHFVPGAWQAYQAELLKRASPGAPGGGAIRYGDVLFALWTQRVQLTGNGSATWILAASGLAWAFSVGALAALWRHLDRALFMLADVLVLVAAGGGFFMWYLIFQNHSYEHAWLMVRMLGVPTAYGFVAAMTVWSAYRAAAPDAASSGYLAV
jgi:hypothetical protein